MKRVNTSTIKHTIKKNLTDLMKNSMTLLTIVTKVRGSKVKRLDTAKIDTCEVSVLVKMPASMAGK